MSHWQKVKNRQQAMGDPGTELPKTMLILKSNSTVLTVVETFLRNRGWKIYSTPNLKEALVQIVQQKPSYVVISVDHPNKKVRALPKLLAQAFPVAIIVFAENQNSVSYKMLNETATEYRVYPPVTGPAIERCVNKYLKDQQTRHSLETSNDDFKTENPNGDNGIISVKGGGKDHIKVDGGTSQFSSESAHRLLSQFLNEDNGGAANSGAAANSSTKTANDNSLIFAQPAEDEGAGGFGNTFVQKGSAGPEGTFVPSEGDAGFGQAQGGGLANGLGGNSQQDSANGGNASYIPNSVTADPSMGSREYRRSQQAPSWAPVSQEDREQHLRNKKALSDANDTLIARGTQKSLEASVEIRDGVVKEKIQETANMACIMVESVRFSGYLVAVMGKNQTIDAEFVQTIKQRLFKFLKDNGENVTEEEAMSLKIKQVDFEPWALEYAEFLRKSVHKGNEVAMAFFPRRPIKVIVEDSHHKDMAKIQLNDLQGDRQVEFDLYVYLPNNNKYVLYTPKGGVFYNKQLERLKNQGVTHMHVQKDALQAVSKYQAQNYLNDLVDDFDQKQNLVSKIKAA